MAGVTMLGSVLSSQLSARCTVHKQDVSGPSICSARARSLSCKPTFRGGSLAQLTRAHQPAWSRRHRGSFTVQAGLGDVGKYLSEAAAAVFSPTQESVPWSGGEP